MAVQQFSVFIIIISCLCANVSLGQQQLQFYYCEASGVHVPLEAQCNGVPECPHGEDEQFCGQQQQLFMQEQQEPIEETIPIGLSEDFVKLPAHLQERQFEPNVNGFNNYLDYDYAGTGWSPPPFNIPPQQQPSQFSPCSLLAPQPVIQPDCPIPWLRRPQDRFYFDRNSQSCQQFTYPGCGNAGIQENNFESQQECSDLCGISSGFGYGGGQQQPQTFVCPSDGLSIDGSQVCDGNPDCAMAEDESNCESTTDTSLIIELTSANYDAVVASHGQIVVEFYAPWCKACQVFESEFEKAALEARNSGLNIAFAKVNTVTQPELKDRFMVERYPTLLYYDLRFPIPKHYHKKFGLTSSRFISWLRSQALSEPMPPCRLYEFQCPDSLCLQERLVCDGQWNCRDGSDEALCAPLAPTTTASSTLTTTTTTTTTTSTSVVIEECGFRCNDGSCQPSSARCNGVQDCADGIDESGCSHSAVSCKRTQFRCASQDQCIDYLRRCDGQPDCQDGSDESRLCQLANCSHAEFICESQAKCVSFALRCDGNVDCADASDEFGCPVKCDPLLQFTCNDGMCIDINLRCDGVPDCHDSTDELSCPSSPSSPEVECDPTLEWRCSDGRGCIDVRRRCDGYPDCADLSDENELICPMMECNVDWQFQCADRKRCIDKRRRCDAYSDCADGSDEQDCLDVECDYWQFKCMSDGICIDARRKCDGIDDCKDGTDEITDCNVQPEITTPATTTTTTTSTVPCQMFCPAEVYEPVCGSDGETYSSICHMEQTACLSDRVYELTLASYGECPVEPGESGQVSCRDYEWGCHDGSCILFSQQCDGIPHCEGGEDEKFCSTDEELEETAVESDSNQVEESGSFECYDGQVLPLEAVCDGFPTCLEGEDETNCSPKGGTVLSSSDDEVQIASCDPLDEFTCKADGSCRPIGVRCDNMVDCPDESDEFDCPNDNDDNNNNVGENDWFGDGFDIDIEGGEEAVEEPLLVEYETEIEDNEYYQEFNKTSYDDVYSEANETTSLYDDDDDWY